jgi:hypothetical protein
MANIVPYKNDPFSHTVVGFFVIFGLTFDTFDITHLQRRSILGALRLKNILHILEISVGLELLGPAK